MEHDDVDTEIEAIAEEYDEDPEDVRDLYEKKLEAIKAADVIGVDEEEFPVHAFRTVRSNLQKVERVGGEAVEVPILGLGYHFVTENWGKNNDTVMVAVGVVAPEDTENENRPPGLGVFILNESRGIDVGKARELFTWGQHIRGWFDISKFTEDFAARDRSYYRLDTTNRSKIEEADFSGSLPDDPETICRFIGDNFVKEAFTLDTIAENLSMEDGEEFGSSWLDLRRFEGKVVDYFRRTIGDCEPDQNPFGKYVLVDHTLDHAEIEQHPELLTDEDRENGRQPGLQVMLPPEAVKYGEDSTIEVYGTLERNDDTGQITLRGVGAAPVIPFPLDEDEGEDHDETEEEAL